MKILIVDDHRSVVNDLMLELHELLPDAETTGTTRPEEILTLCREKQFDVIFIDIDLGNVNGIRIAKDILAEFPRTNIIYITGYEEYALESYETNASSFLLKPVTSEKIQRALEHLRFPVSSITDEMLTGIHNGEALIGRKIQRYREERGLTRESFTNLVGVDLSTVYRWESGARIPDVPTLMRIARVLGVGISELV